MNNLVQMPNTTEFQLGNLTLQLRLDGRAILNIEKRIGENMMGVFMKNNGEFRIPKTEELLVILQGANKTSGVSTETIERAYDQYIEQGNSSMELFQQVQIFLADEGFFGKEEKGKVTNGESTVQTTVVETQVTETQTAEVSTTPMM